MRQVIIDTEKNWEEVSNATLKENNMREKKEQFFIQILQKGGENDSVNQNALLQYRHLPLPRLWKPDPLVQKDVLHFLKMKLVSHLSPDSTSNESINEEMVKNQELQVWDLGSGSGRDLAFLAEELKCHFYNHLSEKEETKASSPCFPFQFVGFDNHKGSSKRCMPFWKHRLVSDVTYSFLFDLNKVPLFQELLAKQHQKQPADSSHEIDNLNNSYKEDESNEKAIATTASLREEEDHSTNKSDQNNQAKKNPNDVFHAMTTTTNKSLSSFPFSRNKLICLYAIRYLNRKLLHYITSDECLFLEKGTVFAMSHFCKKDQDCKWEFDHPKEKHVLERMELYDLFTTGNKSKQNQWEVLKNDICLDGDHGRTLIQFVAIRT